MTGARDAGDAGGGHGPGPAGGSGGRSFAPDELARLCGVTPAAVKSWRERDLLRAERGGGEPRFAFRQLGVARALAQLAHAGWTPARIAKAARLARAVVPDPEAAIAGLVASIGRARVTVRTPDGRLVEPGGQQLFDFDAAPADAEGAAPVLAMRTPHDWFVAGTEAEADGRLEDAITAYERSLPHAGAEACFNLGNCLYALGRSEAARDRFVAAVAKAPDYAEAWNNLGIARGALGDSAGAVQALRRALELVPYYADAHFNLADALAAAGAIDEAREHWRAYLTFDPNSRWADQVRRRLGPTAPGASDR